MTITTLLLREDSTISLSTIVEKSQSRKPPFLEYDLQLNNNKLDLILTSNSERIVKSTSSDEGFESDIDSLSIVSSDDSFTSNLQENGSKTNEIDSANGSSSSDSDTDSKTDTITSKNVNTVTKSGVTNACKETFDLVNCLCYTDVKFPDILVFVIKNETFVFKFANLNNLQNFYTNFTALKAVANQKAYNKNFPAKFNLLQRTDNNGITHIEITREPDNVFLKDEGPSSIISINAPESSEDKKILQRNLEDKHALKVKSANSRQRTESKIIQDDIHKSASSEDILSYNNESVKLVKNISPNADSSLRKVWNSAEDILDGPKRPERRKKVKGKAPLPPNYMPNENKGVYSGQYVRVNVNFDITKDDKNRLIIKSQCNEPHPKKLQNFKLLTTKPNLTGFLKSKPSYPEVKQIETSTLNRNKPYMENSWTNSVPRILKKNRSKSETRQFTPMAYRYIDTTQNYPVNYNLQGTSARGLFSHGISSGFSSIGRGNSPPNMSNRLFGLSSKLRDFSTSDVKSDEKWGEVGGGNLKSVIKKDENKKKNEKKVTFSAYTTVQVV